jgi:hypothetical protein
MKNGDRQIVVLGESNENNVIVEQGIEPGTVLYLNTPEEPEKFNKLLGQELISVIKEKEKAKKEAEKQANEQTQRRSFGGRGGFGGEMTPEMRQQFENMRNQMQQGGQMDTAAIRRMREMRQRNGGQMGPDGQQGTRQQGTRQQGMQPNQQPAQETTVNR